MCSSQPWEVRAGKRPQAGAILAGNSQVPVTPVKVQKEASLDLGGHILLAPHISHGLMESGVTQEGLEWGPQEWAPGK